MNNEPYQNPNTQPSAPESTTGLIVDTQESHESDTKPSKRGKKIGITVGAIVAGIGVLAGGATIVGNIMRGPSQGGPNPVDTPTSEATPSPEATVPAEAFDATKFDILATATDQEIGQGYANLTTVEFTSGLSAKATATEYQNRSDFSQTLEDFSLKKATAIIDALYKEQYIAGWENVPSLIAQHNYAINQCALRIQILIATADNPTMFKEQFTLAGTPNVKPGANPNQKIATILLTETNNGKAAGVHQTDGSLETINNTTTTTTVTYVIVDGKLRIADEVSTLNK